MCADCAKYDHELVINYAKPCISSCVFIEIKKQVGGKMRERDILIAIGKSIAEARFGAYALLECNEAFGERLDAKFREAAAMLKARERAINRRQSLDARPLKSASA
jgi:hypothetical protein